MACTASRSIPRATSTRPRPTRVNAFRNSSSKASAACRPASKAHSGRSAEADGRRRFEIELTIIKQGEFELAANLGCVREIQYELSGAVPMGPTPILWQRDNIFRRIGQSAQDPAVFRRQRSAQRLGYVTGIQHL